MKLRFEGTGVRRVTWPKGGIFLRSWLCVLGLAAVLSACAGESPPNVVLISIDCLNERQMEEALASGKVPHIKALADESLKFTRAYAQAPWTTPSHMSMLTGLYPSQHGRDVPFRLMFYGGSMDERVAEFESLADRLSAAGYETVAFVGQGSISGRFGLDQGFSIYHESRRWNVEASDLPATDEAIREWFDKREKKPFFLFLHTYDFHTLLPPGQPVVVKPLDYVDGFVGRLLDLLREHDVYDSTVIFFTGDHGSEMIKTEGKCCVHGAGHYQENLNVPLILKVPAPGKVGQSDRVVRHIDILPTVLDVVGLPTGSYRGEGVSLLGRLNDGTADDGLSYSEADGRCAARLGIVSARYNYIYTLQDPLQRALISNPEFYDERCNEAPLCKHPASEELYDLRNDPFEEQNLLRRPLKPEAKSELQRLREEMTRHRNLPRDYDFGLALNQPKWEAGKARKPAGAKASGGPGAKTPAEEKQKAEEASQPSAAPTVELDESVRESLRALGYGEN